MNKFSLIDYMVFDHKESIRYGDEKFFGKYLLVKRLPKKGDYFFALGRYQNHWLHRVSNVFPDLGRMSVERDGYWDHAPEHTVVASDNPLAKIPLTGAPDGKKLVWDNLLDAPYMADGELVFVGEEEISKMIEHCGDAFFAKPEPCPINNF